VELALAVVVLAADLHRGIRSASGPFEVVVGPKGSATGLVMNTALLQDLHLGNIAYRQYQELRADPRVKDAVPIALGDSVPEVRIFGTTPAFFEVAVTPDRPPFYPSRRATLSQPTLKLSWAARPRHD